LIKNRLLRFPFSSIAFVFAVIVVSAALISDINLIEMPVSVMNRIAQHEVDDVIMTLVLLVLALVVDQFRNARTDKRDAERQAERQAEQLRVVQVTMRTVQDIVNNALNQLQLIRVDAEGFVPEESLDLFDKTIQETSAKLKTLGDLKVFAEKQMAVGSGLDVNAAATTL
jgi:SNF family Na+-dependent transporter